VRATAHLLVSAFLLVSSGCAPLLDGPAGRRNRVEVTITQRAQLESFESLIPVPTDSIIALYAEDQSDEFQMKYRPLVEFVSSLVDSFNTTVDSRHAIDTLCINHALENFAEAGHIGRTLVISSSYFFLFNDKQILRSLLTHEFGHIRYRTLDSAATGQTAALWEQLRESALFYLFRDGEYSDNARFGGHPEDSPSELFASAYNLVRNRPDELRARFRYVDSSHNSLLAQVVDLVSR
jgi:hypothetical protein